MARTPQLTLRVPYQEKATWKAKAQAAGMSVAEWVRSKCTCATECASEAAQMRAEAAEISLTESVRSRCAPDVEKIPATEERPVEAVEAEDTQSQDPVSPWEPCPDCAFPPRCQLFGPLCKACKDAAAQKRAEAAAFIRSILAEPRSAPPRLQAWSDVGAQAKQLQGDSSLDR